MTGFFEVDIDFDHLRVAPEEIAPEALGEAMEHIRGAAVEQTPVETGRLAGSATVHVDGDEASLTFEGPYARYQHERLDLRHEHGNAKYLEIPMHTEENTALSILAQRVREAL